MPYKRDQLSPLHKVPNTYSLISTRSGTDSPYPTKLLILENLQALNLIFMYWERIDALYIVMGLKIDQIWQWEHKNFFIITRTNKVLLISITTSNPLFMVIVDSSSTVPWLSIPDFNCFVSWTTHSELSLFYAENFGNSMFVADETFVTREIWKIGFVCFIGWFPKLDFHVAGTRSKYVLGELDWIYTMGVSFQDFDTFF